MAANSTVPFDLTSIGKLQELRQRLLFVLIALVVYRFTAFVPVPGINPVALAEMFNQQRGTILDMLNMFSGGALERFSIVTLGLMPYITAAIVVQVFSMVDPRLKQLRKEGEMGRRKLTQYTRYATLGLASFQSFVAAVTLEGQQVAAGSVVMDPGIGFRMVTVVTLVTGTMFMMWLGEQITERGIGNGISLLIFAGIVANLPSAIGGTIELARTGELHVLGLFALLALAIGVTAFVVYVERGQRRITVNYARRQMGRRAMAAQTSHLPLKLNMAGVIPPIFASSIILFPASMGRWFGQGSGGTGISSWLQGLVNSMSPGQPLYVILYATFIVFFCFFYTALVFDPRETAENLKKSGGFVPGLRPGEQTARYLDQVLSRLTLAGAIYITGVCLLPEFLVLEFNVPFYFGGTSLLIIVVVVMDFMAQVQAHLMSHQYEGLMKKANLKSHGRLRRG